MRIVIDLQAAQAASTRNRGIGRYSRGLAQAILRNRGAHEVLLALNAAYPETIEPIRAQFEPLLPSDRIHVFEVLDPLADRNWSNDPRRIASEICREAFLSNLNPDVLHVSTMVEGMRENAVASIGRIRANFPTTVTVYDLIPLANPSQYLRDVDVAHWYRERLDHLQRADLLLAISEWSAAETLDRLSVDAGRVVNVGSAADSSFGRVGLGDAERLRFLSRYEISRPFVMYTGGLDVRKNIEGLVRAFARLPAAVRNRHQLVIACEFPKADKQRLLDLLRSTGLAADALVVTGFIEDSELAALYSLAKLFIFPSLSEGFGLPLLEAMQCGTPVMGSNCSSILEVVGLEQALFDPHDPKSIRDAMLPALVDDSHLALLRENAAKQAGRFSWNSVGRRAVAAFEKLHRRKRRETKPKCASGRKPRLAYVSPIPPTASGIATYSQQLLPHLDRYYYVDAVVEDDLAGSDSVGGELTGASQVISSSEFLHRADEYDRVLYQFGNSEFHDYMLPLIDAVPGVVTLHDVNISGLVRHHAFRDAASDEEGELNWLAALYRNHGAAAVIQCAEVAASQVADPTYPCCITVVGGSTGVIVHSAYARTLASRWFAPERASHFIDVPMACPLPDGIDRDSARQRLGISEDSLVICSFGHIGPTKCSLDLLSAWMNSAAFRDPECRLVFVGARGAGEYTQMLEGEIARNELGERVEITGWLDDFRYRAYLASCDLAVQLRTDSHGESSLTVLECLSFGVPTIVNANGAMAELPPKAVRLLPDRFKAEELRDAIDALCTGGASSRALGKAGREFVSAVHAPADCAKRISEVVEQFYSRPHDLVPPLTPHAAALPPDDVSRLANIAAEATKVATVRTIALDVSEFADPSAESDERRIERLVRYATGDLPADWRLELIRYDDELGAYVTAHGCLGSVLGLDAPLMADEPVEFAAGDAVVCADSRSEAVASRGGHIEQLRRRSVRLLFLVDDVRDFRLGEVSPDRASDVFEAWLAVVAGADRVVCSSRSMADELLACLDAIEFPHVKVGISPILFEGKDRSTPEPVSLAAYLR